MSVRYHTPELSWLPVDSCGEEPMQLDTLEVERSPIGRPDSDCWDVKLTTLNPSKVFEQARNVYRYTIDVSDLVPVTAGLVRATGTLRGFRR